MSEEFSITKDLLKALEEKIQVEVNGITTTLTKISEKVDSINEKTIVVEVKLEQLEKRTAGYAKFFRWLLYTVAGVVVGAAATWVINGGLAG